MDWEALGNSSSDPCMDNYNNTCNSVTIHGIQIKSPALIPTCILAAVIGYVGYTTLNKLSSCLGHHSYAISFAMYGCMMTSAALADSILPANAGTTLETIVTVIDVGLTSSIATSFFWNGLIDMKFIQEWSSSTRKLMLASYTAIFAGWIYGIVNQEYIVWQYLYVDLITITCGLYGILEVISIAKSHDYTGIKYLLLAGTAGIAGIYTRDANTWLCHTFGCFFAGSFWWFVFSDVAMYFVLRYYVARVAQRTENPDQVSMMPMEIPQGYILLQSIPVQDTVTYLPAF